MTAQHRQPRDIPTVGLAVAVALAAAVMSAAAWAKLGELVGITQVLVVFAITVHLAWLLPVSVDAYALLTARVWLTSPHASEDTKGYARKTALFAIGQSIAGNALYHLIVEMHLNAKPIWPIIVVLVSGIPALQLGLALHLIALVHGDRQRSTQTSAPVDDSPLAGAATNSGAGGVPPWPAPAAPSPVAGDHSETAPVPAIESAPVDAAPVASEAAPVPVQERSAPVAPVTVPERSGQAAPVTTGTPAPERPTGAPERPRSEHRQKRAPERSAPRRRPAAKNAPVPTKDEKISAAVDAIVEHFDREKKKPTQRELKLALEFPPRNDDMPDVYRLADEALTRKAKAAHG